MLTGKTRKKAKSNNEPAETERSTIQTLMQWEGRVIGKEKQGYGKRREKNNDGKFQV